MEERERKKSTSVFVREDILEHVKINPHIKNLSEWINNRYFDDFTTVESEEQRVKELNKQVSECKRNIKIMRDQQNKLLISDAAKEWISSEGIKRIHKFQFDSVLRYFNKKFDMHLSASQFRIIIDRIKKSSR